MNSNPLKGLGIAGTTFLCLLLAVPAARSSDALDKIAKKISAGAKELSNKKVAVLPFPYHDGRESKGSTIVSERLITKLVERRRLEVIERSLMEKVLSELKLQSSGAVDEQSAKQIGKILGVEAIVSGTLIDLGEKEVEVNARLIRAETGQIVVAAGGSVERFWQESPLPAAPVHEAAPAEPMRPALVLANHPTESGAEFQPQPVELEESFWVGGEQGFLFDSGFDQQLVNSPFGRKFAEGLQMLRRGEGTEAETYFAEMAEKHGGNPRVAALLRLGRSMSRFVQGDRKGAIRQAEEIARLRQWPRISSVAHFVLGRYYEKMGRPEEARQRYLDVVRTVPFQTPLVKSAGRKVAGLHPGNAVSLMPEHVPPPVMPKKFRR